MWWWRHGRCLWQWCLVVYFILNLLASQDTQWAKMHYNLTTLDSYFFFLFLLSRNLKFEAYVEMWMRNISFRPLYIRRWFFVSVAVQSFVHLLLWRPPEGFFSTLPFLRSYVILVWSWQQRSALLVSHTVASFL